MSTTRTSPTNRRWRWSAPTSPRRSADKAIALYKAAAEIALKKGIIIADTKFEFGLDKNGTVVLMDEVLTPDSSRYYWPADQYAVGSNPPSYDKQFLRDWLESAKVNGQPWDKAPPLAAPAARGDREDGGEVPGSAHAAAGLSVTGSPLRSDCVIA